MNEHEIALRIVPEAKVAAVTQEFPALEPLLEELSPSLRRVTNPGLKMMVRSATTLEMVAHSARMEVAELITALRKAARGEGVSDCPEAEGATPSPEAKPEWAAETALAGELDARPLLARGEHPVAQVIQEAAGLLRGQVYRLTTPFLPAPLIDKVEAQGFESWSQEVEPGKFESWFRKR